MLSSDLEGANTLFASFQAARTKTGPISDFCIHDSRTDWPKWQECHSSKLLNTGFQEGGEDYFDETNHWQKRQDFNHMLGNFVQVLYHKKVYAPFPSSSFRMRIASKTRAGGCWMKFG